MLPKQLQHLMEPTQDPKISLRKIVRSHLLMLGIVMILWIGPFYVGKMTAWNFHPHALYYIYGLGFLSLLYILHLIFYWKLYRNKS